VAAKFVEVAKRAAALGLALFVELRPGVGLAIGREHFEPSQAIEHGSLDWRPGSERVKEELTAERVKYGVGLELARRGLQLVEFGVRLRFEREAQGEWFAQLDNPHTGCELSTSAGSFDVLSVERAQSIALALEPLIARCANLSPAAAQARRESASAWVKPTAGAHAAVSAITLLGLSASSPPNASLDLSHAPNAALVSGLGVAILGGGATLFVPPSIGERTLPLSFFSSGALLGLGFALAPEPGVPSYSGFALASGYALTSALLGLDWALHPISAASEDDIGSSVATPSRLRAGWACYLPAVAGSLASMAPALAPSLSAEDRELVLGLGGVALIPAGVGIALSASEPRAQAPLVVGAGPRGSAGLSLRGSF
jgi:hypothetical protein